MKHGLDYLYDLIIIITQKELKVRYKSSFFGYLWSVANPLLFVMICFYFQINYAGSNTKLYCFYYYWPFPMAMVCKCN